jgi:hypothetical protein
MLVSCLTLGEFLANLRDEPSSGVLRQTVYLSVVTMPVNDAIQDVLFQVSTVVCLGDDGQYLLRCGEVCGRECLGDPIESRRGTLTAERLKATLHEFCDDRGLKVRPGLLDF